MHIPPEILKPRPEQLRQFAIILPLAVLLICWALELRWLAIVAAIGGSLLLAIVGWRYPGSLRFAFIALTLIALPLGLILRELVLISVYFGLVTPIGLIFRMLQRDPLERTIDREASSYWRSKRHPKHPSSYLRRW